MDVAAFVSIVSVNVLPVVGKVLTSDRWFTIYAVVTSNGNTSMTTLNDNNPMQMVPGQRRGCSSSVCVVE